MHPIVILFLLFAALGGMGYLWTTKSAPLLGPLAALRARFGLSDHLVVTFVIGVVALWVLYQIYVVIRTATLNRQANTRLRESSKTQDSQYTNRR